MTPRVGGQDGVISIEVVLLTPVLLALLGLVVLAGRVGETRQAVVHAAQQAARAASLRDTPAGATTAAEESAAANLAALEVACAQREVTVEADALAPGGQVTVRVACTVELAEVAVAGLPGRRTLSAAASEVVDRFRGDP